jgi:arylsulfate sulfotransferase
VAFGILPKPGSFTDPVVARYQANYLAARGYLTSTSITVPVFGLYSGSNNIIGLFFLFADGSQAEAEVPVNTASYTDPCRPLNAPLLQQHRQAGSDLNFSYFLLKDYCSPNSPAIFDTDGNPRWVATAKVASEPAAVYNNGIYTSNGRTGVNRIELYGAVTRIGDYAAKYGVTSTHSHNFDVGRDGIVLDVDTNKEIEAVSLEIDGTTGKVLNQWDLGQIISAAMVAGGDKPDQFVLSFPADWFHMNATTYNPADNTLIVSSRENFVIAVDYDTPPDGVKKIHWILGDVTKNWNKFSSLKRFALQLAPGTLPPIGQHSVSIDDKGNLLLFDDGLGSLLQSPAGTTRQYSAVRSYQIDTGAMTAKAAFTYTPRPDIYSRICGSVYESAPGNYLVDFATAKDGRTLEIQGLGNLNQVVFDLQFSQLNRCGAGWNALPILSQPIDFR